MSGTEYCVNFKGCMYVIVDLIIFVFVLTCWLFTGIFVIIIWLDGVGDIHRCPIGLTVVTDPLGATINWWQCFGGTTKWSAAARNKKLGVVTVARNKLVASCKTE
jgi:hypothetical protein